MINNKCEQFRAWNRVEGLTATDNMEESLRAELYDPLWMLARQQQFGEFVGNDCGTAVTIKIAHELESITFSEGGNIGDKYNKEFDFKREPPEARIEAVKPVLGTFEAIEAGAQLRKIISSFMADSDSLNEVFEQLIQICPVISDDDSLDLVEGYEEMLFCFGEDLIDGVNFYHKLMEEDKVSINKLPIEQSAYHSIVTLYKKWFEDLYGEYLDLYNNWQSERLEYKAEFVVGNKSTSDDDSKIVAEEYFTGNLEWFNFDFVDSVENKNHELTVKQYLPTKLTYPGMPSDRWWEIEDESVDFINIDADQTDIAKLVVSEFASLYSNDWLTTPLDVPYGMVCRVKSALVMDTFGEYIYIPNKISGQAGEKWDLFSMFNAEPNENIDGLVLFPSIHKVQDSDPIEQVTFKRDEMANVVWGIEEKLSNNMGCSSSGDIFAAHSTPPEEQTDYTEDLLYSFMSQIPSNWIPFVPVRIAGSDDQIKLKRASLPIKNGEQVKSPKTKILMPEQGRSQYIYEEEILKGGITVSGTYQRARWYNGKTCNWFGYKKVPGKNIKNSDLKVDFIQKVID